MDIVKGRIKIVSGLLIGGLLLAGTPVIAASQTDPGSLGNPPVAGARMVNRGGPGMMDAVMDKEIMNNLVSKGIIDQETADKLQSYLQEKHTPGNENQKPTREQKGAPTNFLAGTVTDGIISQAQADAISKYIQGLAAEQAQARKARQQEEMTEAFDSLVSAKTITADQAKAITEFLKNAQETRAAELEKLKDLTSAERKAYLEKEQEVWKAEMEKVKDMSETERQAYFAKNRKSPLSELVTNGTLTEAEAEAVTKVLFAKDRGMNE